MFGIGVAIVAALVVLAILVAGLIIWRRLTDPSRTTEEPRATIESCVSPDQQAAMLSFVTNVLGYGTDAEHFSKLRARLLNDCDPYLIAQHIEHVRIGHHIPVPEQMTFGERRLLTKILEGNILLQVACARSATFLDSLAERCRMAIDAGESIPEDLVPDQSVVDAYLNLERALFG